MGINPMKNPYADKPCERCGSKKRVSKTWKERIPTFNGTTLVEFSQFVCTNKECQQEFEENIKKENKKKESLRLEKEKKEKIRKANSLRNAKKARKAPTKKKK